MADDIAITAGTGTTVATDEVSARHYQLIKLAHGADGSATLVSGSSGLPVNVLNTSLTVVGSGTFTVDETSHINTAGSLLSSSARTTGTNSSDQTNLYAPGVTVYLDVTATPNNAETLTVAIQGKDPVSGKYVTLTGFTALVASAIGATSTTATYAYKLYPGASKTGTVANMEVSAANLGRTWRVLTTHSSTGSWTYSVGYTYSL